MKKVAALLFIFFLVVGLSHTAYAVTEKELILWEFQLEKIPNGKKYISELENIFKDIQNKPQSLEKLLLRMQKIQGRISVQEEPSLKEKHKQILINFIIKKCEFYISSKILSETDIDSLLEEFYTYIYFSEASFFQYLDTLKISNLEYISDEIYGKDFTKEINTRAEKEEYQNTPNYSTKQEYQDALNYLKKDLFDQAFLLKRKNLLEEKTFEYRKKMERIKYEIENSYLKNGGKLEDLIKEEIGKRETEDLTMITGLLDYEVLGFKKYDFDQDDITRPYIGYYYYNDPKNGPQIFFQILSYLNISDLTSIVLIEGNYQRSEPFYYVSLFYDPNRETSISDGDIFANIK